MGSAVNKATAVAACSWWSPVRNRTSTLVSTASMASRDGSANRSVHFLDGFRFASLGVQASRNIFYLGGRETPGGAEQNPAGGFFDGKFCAGSPGVSRTNLLRQYDLAFGGELGGLHLVRL